MATLVRIIPVRFEHLREALGIGVATPSLSWRAEGAPDGWTQAAYDVAATDDQGRVAWSSGRIASEECVLVSWPGPPLRSRERQHVRVRVWDAGGAESPWSEPAALEAGLLDAAEWSARFIAPERAEDTSVMQPAVMPRREFIARAGIARARLYITALGLYEAEINGKRVGDHVLAPGWSSYNARLRYQRFDVTEMLREGANAIGAILGDGWYRGRIGFPGAGGRNVYGDRTALLAQLEIAYAGGATDVIATDDSWRCSEGPVRSSGIYEGETYDARLELAGWSGAGFDDRLWGPVHIIHRDLTTLVAPPGPPVRMQEELAPLSIATPPSGRTLVDFGQNLAGHVRITAGGDAGDTITLRHAEVLEDGELCTRPLRGADATDRYTMRGGISETWEPRFTFHGFRYAEVDGWPGEVTPDALRAVACYSDMERTGWFSCSDGLLNRLHENAVWSMRSNFLDVPTDCPQRDERLGWTGDLSMFAPSACFLYDAAGVLTSWLADLRADQGDDGVVPIVVPRLPGAMMGMAQAVWGDAAVIVPWTLYERYGDIGILEAQYESMRAWVDAVARLAGPGRLWDRGFQFADWLDPTAPPEEPQRAMTDPHLVATAYFQHVAELLSRAAALIGREEDLARYAQLAAEVRVAFVREYVTPNGRVASDSQTAYAVAIAFDLFETPEQRERAGRRLASLIRHNRYRIGTGFVGTGLVLDALCASGETETAFRLLMERSCPSWLYPVTMGATTIWERWDSMLADGRVNPGEMTSFNHYALGSVVDWLHLRVGGLAPAAPGYRRIEVAPLVSGGLTWAEARHVTPYGLATVRWDLRDGAIDLEATVPPNTSARIVPPDGSPGFDVASGRHGWSFAALG